MSKELPKTYDHSDVESRLYEKWEKKGYFHAEANPEKKPYCIVMPPPNITGKLHMGHALDNTLQDSIIRYKRMNGYETLWLPGTDHASIATEVKIVTEMAKEGIDKRDIGREAFLKRAWEWRREYGGTIVKQLRKMGSSCDWERERFTMDEGCNRAVTKVFVDLYKEGLIYRDDRINWCPVCQTALSDAEVEYEEQASHLWHVRYDAPDKSYSIICATTRPETIPGDTAIAVNPEDERYAGLIGKTVVVPIVGREIPIVADEYVEKEFGSGAVKITPCHDPNDFEVGVRHNLPRIRVFTDDGHLNELGAPYTGMTTMKCRKAIVADMEKSGNLVKIEDYAHNVGVCYRCHNTVEPLTSLQWFVSMKPLAKEAIRVVEEGEVKFVPERFNKTYFNWMYNIRDWCISRQLWWGHRIPAYYCENPDCGHIEVTLDPPEKCPVCGAKVHQDEDVLDTWFSSGMWPFSTLGWPDNTGDLKYFYPTSTLVTGYDIIFFWVARMIFSGLEQMGHVPFDTVLIHGLVRDEQGRKMSKSLGNGIDPLEVIDQYGADALRFSLCMGISPGNDTRYSTTKLESARNFANKVWNASRFVLMNLDGVETLEGKTLQLPDQWILSRYHECAQEVTAHFDECEFGLAAQKIYDFAWSEFCDWYIELAKGGLLGEDAQRKATVRAVLSYVLSGLLRMLHPFMPFLTETVYAFLPGCEEASCMLSDWPRAEESPFFPAQEAQMEGIMEIIRAVRNLRAEMNVQAGHKARLMLRPADGWQDAVAGAEVFFQRLASASELDVLSSDQAVTEKTVGAVVTAGEILIPLGDLVDIEKEIARLNKERDNLLKEIARAEGKLNNEGFLRKAPEALVQAERDKLVANQTKLTALDARIADLKQ